MNKSNIISMHNYVGLKFLNLIYYFFSQMFTLNIDIHKLFWTLLTILLFQHGQEILSIQIFGIIHKNSFYNCILNIRTMKEIPLTIQKNVMQWFLFRMLLLSFGFYFELWGSHFVFVSKIKLSFGLGFENQGFHLVFVSKV